MKQNKFSASTATHRREVIELPTQSESTTLMDLNVAGLFNILAGNSVAVKSVYTILTAKIICGGVHVITK
jgi:hypothetical protein